MSAPRRTPRFQRARAPERKTERRDAILDAAERMLRDAPFEAIHVERVARRLGLAKGTLYLYFETKEALFLAVLRRVYQGFFDALDAALPPGRATRDTVRAALLDSLEASPALRPLASVLHSALEHNAGDAEIAAFKHFLRDRVTTLGGRIDRCLRWPPGSGSALLLRFHVLVIGLHHVSTPSRAVERALADDSLAIFRIDFGAQLAELLRLVMQPLEQEK